MATGYQILSRLLPDSDATIGAASATFTDDALLTDGVRSDAIEYHAATGTPKATHVGHRLHSFVDLFYYRIFVVPAVMDFENIVGNATRQVIVWNAYFAPHNLTAITGFNVDGVTIDAVPAVFNALQARTYNVDVSVDGSPIIDGRYDFVFDVETASMSVLGRRVVAFMFPHDWADQFKETVSYRNEVFPSHRGARQQAVGYRRKPWRKLEINHYVKTAKEAALLEAILYDNQHRAYGVPVWSDHTRLLSDATPGDDVLNLVTDWLDFNDNGILALYKNPFEYEVLGIDTVPAFADLVNLKQSVSGTWPAGTRVVPMIVATLDPDVEASFLTIRNGVLRLNWQAMGKEWGTHRLDASETLPTYRGYPVWLKKNDFGDDVNRHYTRDSQRRGKQLNRFNQYELGVAAQHTNEFKMLLNGRQEISRFLYFLSQRRGRQVPFWYCARSRDMQLAAQITSGDVRIVVDDWGYARYYNVKDSRRDIAIIRPNGTVLMRRITDVLQPPDTAPGTLSLGLDSSIGVSIGPSELPYVRISFLKASRVEADDVELAFQTHTKVTTAFPIKDLQHSL